MKNAKVVSEWIITLNKGDDIVLTENQYNEFERLQQEDDNRRIFFKDVSFNPAFFVSAFKRPMITLRSKYICESCHGGKYNQDQSDWCNVCEGAGVIIKK